MKILHVWADGQHELNTSVFRCFIPHNAINRKYEGRHTSELLHVNDFSAINDTAKKACREADIIVIERNLYGNILNLIYELKNAGKVVVANFDDAYDIMPVSNVAYGYWHKGEARIQYADGREELHYLKPKPLEMFKQALTLVHGIVTPSQKLCDDWARFSYSVLLPNYFEIDNYINHVPPKHDGIFIGWGGSMSHFQSFTDSGVLEALSRIIHKRNDVKLLIAGDKRVYDKVRLPEGKKLFQPYVPHVSWPRVVEQFDIGIAPLCGEYDKRRSWIKPMEYMMLRKPWIASDVGTYDSIRDYGNLTKNYPKKWEEAIDNVLNSIEGQSLKVSNGYEFALKNADVDKNVDNIIAVYQDIADHAGIKIQ